MGVGPEFAELWQDEIENTFSTTPIIKAPNINDSDSDDITNKKSSTNNECQPPEARENAKENTPWKKVG